jgi:ABC-type transport system involved in multi-copper enzyme maturation permease subunit
VSGAPGPSFRVVRLVMRGVFVELVRRRDLYVLLMLMGLFVLGVAAVRVVGIENASTGTFLLNLGLSLAAIPAQIMTILVAARLIPEEMENRTIYPLLAKPVRREEFVVGKWLAASVAGVLAYLVLTAMAWLATPKMESYSAPLFGQALVLQAMGLAALAAMTMAFTLAMPRALGIVLAAGIALVGSKVTAIVVNSARGAEAAQWLVLYVPDFSKLNLVTRYTDGIGPLPAGEFAGLAAYAVILALFFVALSVATFRRRTL